jgi:hypothetical protein
MDGTIIDVTLPIVPSITEDRAYFSGFSYTREEALSLFVAKVKKDETRLFPLRADDRNPFGMKDSNYFSAMVYANIHSGVPAGWYFGGETPCL